MNIFYLMSGFKCCEFSETTLTHTRTPTHTQPTNSHLSHHTTWSRITERSCMTRVENGRNVRHFQIEL